MANKLKGWLVKDPKNEKWSSAERVIYIPKRKNIYSNACSDFYYISPLQVSPQECGASLSPHTHIQSQGTFKHQIRSKKRNIFGGKIRS